MDNIDLINFKDKRNTFINYCLLNEKKIDSNKLFAPKFKKLEAVIIELRLLPHLSFIIKNAIYRLGEDWSFTIICGNNNYEFIKKIISNIQGNIRIIKLDRSNLTREEYSIMLLNSKFWKQFHGEKILIYQEDSIIFKKLDPKFLKYDFIGAPYSNKEIGNGGLSLRSKDIMIQICHKFFDSYETNLIEKAKIIKDNKQYFLDNFGESFFNNNEYYYLYALEKSLLEDLQITNRMKYNNIGILPDFNTAIEFSSEKYYYDNPFGGHQFWYCMKDITIWLDKNLFW